MVVNKYFQRHAVSSCQRWMTDGSVQWFCLFWDQERIVACDQGQFELSHCASNLLEKRSENKRVGVEFAAVWSGPLACFELFSVYSRKRSVKMQSLNALWIFFSVSHGLVTS